MTQGTYKGGIKRIYLILVEAILFLPLGLHHRIDGLRISESDSINSKVLKAELILHESFVSQYSSSRERNIVNSLRVGDHSSNGTM